MEQKNIDSITTFYYIKFIQYLTYCPFDEDDFKHGEFNDFFGIDFFLIFKEYVIEMSTMGYLQQEQKDNLQIFINYLRNNPDKHIDGVSDIFNECIGALNMSNSDNSLEYLISEYAVRTRLKPKLHIYNKSKMEQMLAFTKFSLVCDFLILVSHLYQDTFDPKTVNIVDTDTYVSCLNSFLVIIPPIFKEPTFLANFHAVLEERKQNQTRTQKKDIQKTENEVGTLFV